MIKNLCAKTSGVETASHARHLNCIQSVWRRVMKINQKCPAVGSMFPHP